MTESPAGRLPAVPTAASRGALLIIGATVVSGIAGYAVTFLVFRQAGPAAYSVFAVFWAGLYLLVGGLSGIQQEITRATHPIPFGSRSRASRARTFALSLAVALVVAVVATSPAWAMLVFARQGTELAFPLAVGAGSYVLVATLAGSLYGVSQWRSIALMVVADGLLRLGLVGLVVIFSTNLVVIAWAVALPFPLVILILWPTIRKTFVGRSDLDVGYRALTWNVARTVLASLSTAILVSGFPLILGIAGKSAPAGFVGELIFAITITRAPLIVTVMSLQSFLLVRFRDGGPGRMLWTVLAGLAAAGLVLAALAWWIGPSVLAWVSGGHTDISGDMLGILVLSSALIGALTVTGSAVLARSQHFVYSAGWVAAAVVTILVMSVSLALTGRVELALLVAPIVGLVVHVAWLVLASRRTKTPVSASRAP